MNRDDFKEALLQVMEEKTHWAWPEFTSGQVAKDKLHTHFEQEYEVYVRDFPVLIGRAYVRCPIAEVRQELAENIYEEETGGLSGGTPHPELFLRYPKGLGMDLSRFAHIRLAPAALVYRSWIDHCTMDDEWDAGAAVTTLFIEGTQYERGEIDPKAEKRPAPPLEAHPLVKHYGLDVEDLALTKAHRQIEGDHRAAAWRVMLDHVPEARRSHIVDVMKRSLQTWKAYRDEVALACGLTQP